MDNKDEQLNNGIKEIKNIKMTDVEKTYIFENILNYNETPKTIKTNKVKFFDIFTTHSFYLRTAVYFILLASVGGLFWFNYQGINNGYKTGQNINVNNKNDTNYLNNNLGEDMGQKTIPTTNIKQGLKNTITNITTNNKKNVDGGVMSAALAPVIVYKTRNDYENNIRVCYNNGEITCFPGPTDAVHQRPVKLEGGYLLNKMSGNVVLDTTIDELVNYQGDWFNLIKKENIIDYKPFTEMYSCPSTFGIEEINETILSNRLKIECTDILDK